MTNMMIMFQILGQYDQMGSHGMDIVAEVPKRWLWTQSDFYTQFNGTW